VPTAKAKPKERPKERPGEAKAILGFLAARGLPVSDEARARISSCTDLEQLESWIRQAATVERVEDLFD
jgi:hypothetical protein